MVSVIIWTPSPILDQGRITGLRGGQAKQASCWRWTDEPEIVRRFKEIEVARHSPETTSLGE